MKRLRLYLTLLALTFSAVGIRRPVSDTGQATIGLKPFYISVPLKDVEPGGTYILRINEEEDYEVTLE